MRSSGPIEWVFFDVGNVLLSEERWLAAYADTTYALLCKLAPVARRDAFDAETWACSTVHDTPAIERLLSNAAPGVSLPAAFWDPVIRAYFDLGETQPGTDSVLDDLSTRYSLGVIGNQHPLVHAWMARTGLADRFRVQVYDCDVGFAKPDPRMYLTALERAGCSPDSAVMVGDRLDYDIRPARGVGMRTIRMRAGGKYAVAEPAEAAETPDLEVWSFGEIPDAVRRLDALPQARWAR